MLRNISYTSLPCVILISCGGSGGGGTTQAVQPVPTPSAPIIQEIDGIVWFGGLNGWAIDYDAQTLTRYDYNESTGEITEGRTAPYDPDTGFNDIGPSAFVISGERFYEGDLTHAVTFGTTYQPVSASLTPIENLPQSGTASYAGIAVFHRFNEEVNGNFTAYATPPNEFNTVTGEVEGDFSVTMDFDSFTYDATIENLDHGGVVDRVEFDGRIKARRFPPDFDFSPLNGFLRNGASIFDQSGQQIANSGVGGLSGNFAGENASEVSGFVSFDTRTISQSGGITVEGAGVFLADRE